MTIHNATFMVERHREADVILWLKQELTTLHRAAGTAPRISAMREAGGVSAEHADAASVAFQMEFPDHESAKAWSLTVFNELAARFEKQFAPDAMVFTSLFEVI